MGISYNIGRSDESRAVRLYQMITHIRQVIVSCLQWSVLVDGRQGGNKAKISSLRICSIELIVLIDDVDPVLI